MSVTLKWAVAIGIVVVLAVIGNMIRTRTDAPPPNSSPTTTTPTPGATWNASGYWLDQWGNRFEVTHDGLNFTARGAVSGVATEIKGQLTMAGATFTFSFATGLVLQGTGQVYRDGNDLIHLRVQLSDGTSGDFKINHAT